jgi:hypothetical protein
MQLHPLDLLTRMSPLAFVHCMIYAQLSGELGRVWKYCAHEATWDGVASLLVNGSIAFGLNVVSFTANKKAGALSMTVAGMFLYPNSRYCESLLELFLEANVKQVLTIWLAVVLFDLTMTWNNVFGIFLTLIGGLVYAAVEYREKPGGPSEPR